LARYEEDGNLEALKIALDGEVQLAEMLKKINKLSSYGHVYRLLKIWELLTESGRVMISHMQ